jgi:hypothetical protein
MTEQTPLERGQHHRIDSNLPVPAARPLGDFNMELVGDDVVLFDCLRNRYHTINPAAFEIWQRCDGTLNVDQIADRLVVQKDLVDTAIELLGEAGLLEAPENAFDSTMHRRTMVKLVSAGVLGTVALPLVRTITVPHAVSAASGDECVPGVLDCPLDNQGNAQCCCLNGSSKKYVCRACPCS